MANACVQSQYFSGQGAVLLADRDASGNPTGGFTPVGNVSALTLGVETTTYQHKESCSGARGVDLEIVQEISVSMSMTMESLSKENLALALYGTESLVSAGTVTDEAITAVVDKWVGLNYINISSVVVTDSTGTTTYTEGTDYEVNAAAGSIKVLSAGSIADGDSLLVDYSYTDQDAIEAVTSGTPPIKWVRFEGLNTADTDKPVVIDLYKVSVQPLAELALIGDEITQMAVEAKVLSDSTKTTGSKYFKIRKVA